MLTLKLAIFIGLTFFTYMLGAQEFLQCKPVEIKNSKRLHCPSRSHFFAPRSKAIEEIKPKIIISNQTNTGEQALLEDTKCKVVHFDGVRNIYCNGQLYIQNYNRHDTVAETSIQLNQGRTFKPKSDFDDFQNSTIYNSNSTGISK